MLVLVVDSDGELEVGEVQTYELAISYCHSLQMSRHCQMEQWHQCKVEEGN